MSESTNHNPRLLIVGARHGSLGERIRTAAEAYDFEAIITAGITGDEDMGCDVRNSNSVKEMLGAARPDYVVCTVGVNQAAGVSAHDLRLRMYDAFDTNVIGPMELLRLFLFSNYERAGRRKFVAISSNSARIARTGSIPYVASKAALSMALRSAAREVARVGLDTLIWGYEPGLLSDTPMTAETREQFSGPLHRMPGVDPEGLNPNTMAHRVVADLAASSVGYNGVMFPFDAGEQ
jgi:NAD(P)-dependent dehydrogenase (short-subunit alcohol dehydrogenase family)